MQNKESIFISYRRKDSLSETALIYHHLVIKFGKDNIFKDADKISPGTTFPSRLREAFRNCQVLLVVIGPSWETIEQDGIRRLDNPKDWVRLEVESALSRGIPIIPVLVNRQLMPKPENLPTSIRKICDRQSTNIEKDYFLEHHMSRLIDTVRERLVEYRTKLIKIDKSKPSLHSFPYQEYVYRDTNILKRITRHLLQQETLTLGEPSHLPIEQITWLLDDKKNTLELIKIPSSNSTNYLVSFADKIKGYSIPTNKVHSFYIGKFPISQLQWKIIANLSDDLILEPSRFKGDDRPVESITWEEANQYCEILSKITTDYRFRLPSIEEWQHACRAATIGPSPYGLGHEKVRLISDRSTYPSEYGACACEQSNQARTTSQFLPNRFGLYHMLGNVSEWSKNKWYTKDSKEIPEGYEDDYIDRALACGGSFGHPREDLRFDTVDGVSSNNRHEHVGFRVVMEVV